MGETSGIAFHPVLVGCGLALCAGVIVCGVASWRLARAIGRIRALLAGTKGQRLEELVAHCLERADEVDARCGGLAKRCDTLAETVGGSLQNIGLVRFNAFDDMGSDLSFALALLDARGDGVVVTSIFGREESRTYAKPVRGGGSDYALSVEERQAIARACGAAPGAEQKFARPLSSGRKRKKRVEVNTGDG